MCLAIPGKVVRITDDPSGDRSAEVEYPGERRTASLLFLPDAVVGDFVLVQAGFAIRRLTSGQAEEATQAMARAASLLAGTPGGS